MNTGTSHCDNAVLIVWSIVSLDYYMLISKCGHVLISVIFITL